MSKRSKRKPGVAERCVGGVVLVLLAVVMISFVRSVRSPAEPLFVPKDENIPVPVSHEMQVALKLFPPLGTAGWKDAEEVSVLLPADLPDDEAEAIAKYKVRHVYVGEYESSTDSDQLVRVKIYDTADPVEAAAMFEATRPERAVGLGAGCQGWQFENTGAFWAGRFFTRFERVVPDDEEPTIQTIAGELSGVQIAWGQSYEESSPTGGGEQVLPIVDLAGWLPPDDVRIYSASNLWEKIDGRADHFLMFNVVKMTFGAYRHESEPDSFVDVYIFDMGTPDNAFGIFRSELGADAEPVDVGREGYLSPGCLFYRKGTCYVRVEASGDSEDVARATEAIARTVADSIVDDGTPLWAEATLPEEHQKPRSFAYHAENAFGLDFLSSVFAAEYEADGASWTLFITKSDDPTVLRKTLDAYAAFCADYGEVLKREERQGYTLMVGESGGYYDAVFIRDGYLGGVTAIEDGAKAEELAVQFVESLGTPAKPKPAIEEEPDTEEIMM